MKKVVLIAVFFAVACVSYGQDTEPTQAKFKLYNDSTYLSAEHPTFKQNKMLLGWHWDYGGNKKLSEALGCNQMHGKVPSTGFLARDGFLAKKNVILCNKIVFLGTI